MYKTRGRNGEKLLVLSWCVCVCVWERLFCYSLWMWHCVIQNIFTKFHFVLCTVSLVNVLFLLHWKCHFLENPFPLIQPRGNIFPSGVLFCLLGCFAWNVLFLFDFIPRKSEKKCMLSVWNIWVFSFFFFQRVLVKTTCKHWFLEWYILTVLLVISKCCI